MNITNKIGAVTLAAALTIGGTTAAFAADGSNGSGGKDAVITTVCEHKDEIVTKLTAAQTKINDRLTTLNQRLQQATDANHPRVEARIERRIKRLTKLQTRVANRLEKVPAWIAAHCS